MVVKNWLALLKGIQIPKYLYHTTLAHLYKLKSCIMKPMTTVHASTSQIWLQHRLLVRYNTYWSVQKLCRLPHWHDGGLPGHENGAAIGGKAL